MVHRLNKLAIYTGADWVVKMDSDSILMDLDWLNDEYSYIGSAPARQEITGNGWNGSKFYAYGSVVAYKAQILNELWQFITNKDNLNELVEMCKRYRWKVAEDTLIGLAITNFLHEKHLIGNIGSDKNLFNFF